MIIPIKMIPGQSKICGNHCNDLPFSHAHDSLNLRSVSLSIIRPKDPEEVLDALSNEQYEKDKFLPYWAQQWPACLPLLEFLDTQHQMIFANDSLVCELGCGLGIMTALLSLKGITTIATDISLDSCKYAAANIKQNAERKKVVCFDWRTMPFSIRFDAIIASDILYEQRWIDPIINFINGGLKPGGFALIADPCRNWWSGFKKAAVSSGLNMTTVKTAHVNHGKTCVEILRLNKVP